MQDYTENNSTNSSNQEFLTFSLGDEDYGIDILSVQEIRGYESVTKIANMPEFIKGVINLRGAIVPIVDMRIKFNLKQITYNQFTVVIVLNITGRVIGMVVDGVSDVISLHADQIQSTPEFCPALDTQYLIGIGTLENRMIILLDIEMLMASTDMSLVSDPLQLAA